MNTSKAKKVTKKAEQYKIGFCMDFHGWLDANHYKVHEKMKFKTKHIICV